MSKNEYMKEEDIPTTPQMQRTANNKHRSRNLGQMIANLAYFFKWSQSCD